VSFDEALAVPPEHDAEIVAIDEALVALGTVDARKSQVVELRFFGGLSVDETAGMLKVSPEKMKRDWRYQNSPKNENAPGLIESRDVR
jgi:RNA polymerase sigma-70 factor, ECF subfamily